VANREFNISVLGTILCNAGSTQVFPANRWEHINISSIASENPVPNSCLYASTKGAIDTITIALSKELGPRNIRVNAVAPGLIDTEGNRKIGFVGSTDGNAIAASIPLGA
jgi:3-oxoacyl-[acyl-carrier protein] reductase